MYELYKSDIIQLFEKLDPYEPSISHQTDKTRAKLCQVILKILKETLSALIQYWKENNFLINYFTFLHTFTMVTQANKENKELFSKVPFFNFLPVQQFQGELLSQYSEERWNEIKKISGIHKLTHKQSVLTKKKDFDITGTFYEKLIKGEIN